MCKLKVIADLFKSHAGSAGPQNSEAHAWTCRTIIIITTLWHILRHGLSSFLYIRLTKYSVVNALRKHERYLFVV